MFPLLFLDSQVTHPKSRNCPLSFLHPPFPSPFPVQVLSMSHLDNRNCPLTAVPASHPSPIVSHYCHYSDLPPMKTSWSFSSLQSLHWAHMIPRKNPKPLAEYMNTKSWKLPPTPGFSVPQPPWSEDAPFLPCIFMPSQLLFITDALPRNALLSSPDKHSLLCWD